MIPLVLFLLFFMAFASYSAIEALKALPDVRKSFSLIMVAYIFGIGVTVTTAFLVPGLMVPYMAVTGALIALTVVAGIKAVKK